MEEAGRGRYTLSAGRNEHISKVWIVLEWHLMGKVVTTPLFSHLSFSVVLILLNRSSS